MTKKKQKTSAQTQKNCEVVCGKVSAANTHCKKQLARLKRIEGQVRGLQKMIADDRYCIDVITQTSAVRNALRSFEDAILENHLQTCAMTQMQSSKKSDNQKAVKEILKVYKLKK